MSGHVVKFPRTKRPLPYAPPEVKARPIVMRWLTLFCCVVVFGLFALAWHDFGYLFTGQRP